MEAARSSLVSPRRFFRVQESEEQVNAINGRLKGDGFAVPPPRRLHGMWTFYVEAPGGFTIEVGC
jgi:lactoylglutathione lyase